MTPHRCPMCAHAEPTRADRVRHALTTRVPGIARLRAAWARRGGRPGWRASDYQ